jgi:arginine deiminase
MFPRDLFSVIGAGVVRGRLRCAARRPEGVLTGTLLSEHPDMRPDQAWSSGDLHVEGGDALAVGRGLVVIGAGERTSLAAARTLARRLLDGRAAREVIVAGIPRGGPFHLDLTLTMVDKDAFLVDRPVVEGMTTERWTSGGRERADDGLIAALRAALGPLQVIAGLPGDHDPAWDHGTNVVALRPGTVIAYADNRATNRRLERAGIEVWTVPGRALGKGRGGPRCLTAPLNRAPLEAA